MATDIKCPNCGHQFPMEDAVSEEYKKELREKMTGYIKKKDEELLKKQEEFLRKEQILLQQAQQKEAEYADLFANPYTAAQRGFVDEVILPQDTRRKLIKAFAMLENKVSVTPDRKHGNIPL